jgi:pyridoxal phosphate enzyme (YggS family)
MAVNEEQYNQIVSELSPNNIKLVAVSKIQSQDDIKALYELGQRDFGENYVQELCQKEQALPKDIHWHFIGHLQRNKVKYITPFVHLIHGVDTLDLLKEINKQGAKQGRIIECLLQIHIAQEETKFGMDEAELEAAMAALTSHGQEYSNVLVKGLMGMASFSDNLEKVRSEMRLLKNLFEKYKEESTSNCHFSILSMGMSGDYKIAIEEGSNMVRIGSLLFGARPQK